MAPTAIRICIVIFCFSVTFADDDEPECEITFSDGVEPCDGFDNDFLQCKSMSFVYLNNNESAVSMSGTLAILQSIEDGHQMEMRISKVSGTSCNDVMWVGGSSICGSIKDEKTPWYPVIESMKVTECPISVADYQLKNVLLKDASAADFCSPEMVGDYCIQMALLNERNEKLSCYVSYVSLQDAKKKK